MSSIRTAVRLEIVKDIDAVAVAADMLPEASNGLPPPLRSLPDAELLSAEVVLDAPVALGILDVSTRSPLDVSVDVAKLLTVVVPLRIAEDEDALVLDLDELEGELMLLVLGLGIVVVDSGSELVEELAPSIVPALGQRFPGPPPAKKATMMFVPVMPLFPHALFTGATIDCRASTQARLHPSSPKSDAEHPSITSVYTDLHPEGRFDTRGVKSDKLTAMVAVGSANSAMVGFESRMVMCY